MGKLLGAGVQQDWKTFGRYGTIGLEFALSILLPLFFGRWLDQKLGTGSWLTLIFAGLGLAAGTRTILRALREANREAERLERDERDARKKFDDEIDPQP
jgi:F0F1-type ATP synthase assembly protein I